MTPTILFWEEILTNVFADEVSGVECVISTETTSYTYLVVDGMPHLVGEGDIIHESHNHGYNATVVLTAPDSFTESSPTYTLSLHACDTFETVYATSNPLVATVGAVLTIVVTSLAFFLYDFCVRREFKDQNDVLQAKRQYMRYVSHEVRTPLNSVYMGLEVLKLEYVNILGYDPSGHLEQRPQEGGRNNVKEPKKESRKECELYLLVDEIKNNTQVAVDVLNDLLHYDKIETGTHQLELTLVPIWQLIRKTADEFKLSAAHKQIQYQVNFSVPQQQKKDGQSSTADLEDVLSDVESMPAEMQDLLVVGDAVRIKQVLRNLISNGLKFTPNEGSLQVQVSWVRRRGTLCGARSDEVGRFTRKDGEVVSLAGKGHLQVSVKDSGAGMSQDQLTKLFLEGAQFNVNKLQAGQGSGLGLYIAKGIVEQHNGSLLVASEGLGLGTTFTMTLPLFDVPEGMKGSLSDEKVPRITGAGDASPKVEFSALRILIVDDAMCNRKLLRRLLENAGHICDEAENGTEAVRSVQNAIEGNKTYDTVLMDYEM